MSKHEPYCEGYHLDSLSCREATDLREEEARNPWNCGAEGSSGYHRFDGDRTPDMACQFGCGRTWGELQAESEGAPVITSRSTTTPREPSGSQSRSSATGATGR